MQTFMRTLHAMLFVFATLLREQKVKQKMGAFFTKLKIFLFQFKFFSGVAEHDWSD
jgi:hypothetical protein